MRNLSMTGPEKYFTFYESMAAAAYMEPVTSECSDDFIAVLFESLSLEHFENVDETFWEDIKGQFSEHSIE